jgi:uncharacterized protein YqeY
MLKQQIDQDLKEALLKGNKDLVMTLRGLKSVILYAEVEQGKREAGLGDDEVTRLLAKESKKRQESADLYKQGGDEVRAVKELEEKKAIDVYLPQQLSDEALKELINAVVTELQVSSPQAMGQVIGAVKQRSQGAADGTRIAQFVKERLQQA